MNIALIAHDKKKDVMIKFCNDNKEILGKHLATPHFIKFGENIDGLLAGDLEINVFDAETTEL